jgi:hypothetical protein
MKGTVELPLPQAALVEGSHEESRGSVMVDPGVSVCWVVINNGLDCYKSRSHLIVCINA